MFSERDYSQRPPSGRGPQSFWQGHSMVFRLIVINVVLFLLDGIFGGGLNREFSLMSSGSILSRPLCYVTYQFLHADFWHIFFNMWMLRLFGEMVERRLGGRRLLTMYLVSGVIGGLCWRLATAGGYSEMVGASASIFGIMVAAAMAYPNAVFSLIFPPISMRLWTLTLVYCAFEVISQLSAPQSSIAHLAHLGGALGGFIFMRRLGFRMPIFGEDGNYHTRQNPTGGSPENPPSGRRPQADTSSDDGPFVFSSAELDRILDKMARQGEGQLTLEERRYLRRASLELKKK